MDVAAIVDEVLHRLEGEYRVVGTLVAGSAVADPQNALDVDICTVVHDSVLRQAKLRIGGTHVDLFVVGIERLRFELNRKQHLYLVPLFATGTYWHGERGTVENLQALARRYFEQPAPLSESRAFAVRHRCYSLLRKFERAARNGETTSAGLMAAALVQLAVESYFELHRIWAPGLRHRMAEVAARDPQAAKAVQDVLREPLNRLYDKPGVVRKMLSALIGEAPYAEEIWVE